MTAIKNLVTLLVISLLGSGVLGWFLFQTRSDNDALRAQLTRLEGEHTEALKQRDEQLQRAIENQAVGSAVAGEKYEEQAALPQRNAQSRMCTLV